MNPNTENITCHCGTVFQWTPEDPDSEWNSCFRPKCCQECIDKLDREFESRRLADLEEKRVLRENRFAANIAAIRSKVAIETPELFRRTDLSNPRFNSTAWQAVIDWKPTSEKPSLGMIGETGTCKTRIGYMLAANELVRITTAEHLPTFMFAASYQITNAVMRLFDYRTDESLSQPNSWHNTKITFSEGAKDYLANLRECDVLLIDDIGKGRISPAVAAELFALIDYRYQRLLQTIWTSNSTPEVIATNMSEDIAAPFAGRLNDSSRIFLFE